jgi:hypothetical protein
LVPQDLQVLQDLREKPLLLQDLEEALDLRELQDLRATLVQLEHKVYMLQDQLVP